MAPRHYKLDWIRSGKLLDFLILDSSAYTIFTKQSAISRKRDSLKKTVKKSAKAITRPFKKFNQSISSHSTRQLIPSRSSSAIPPSVDEADGDNAKSVADKGSA